MVAHDPTLAVASVAIAQVVGLDYDAKVLESYIIRSSSKFLVKDNRE